jgi:outer membrane murein-binding lipoprotein Lpp
MGASKKALVVLASLMCCLCLTATHKASAQPPNDDCGDAILVDVGSVTAGMTIGATFDNVGFCGTSNTAPGVWYRVVGTGESSTASTCNDGNDSTGSADYDTKISVFSGDCGNLTCVTGVDDTQGCNGATTKVSWASEFGVEYLILVHAFGSTTTGNFNLSIDEPLEAKFERLEDQVQDLAEIVNDLETKVDSLENHTHSYKTGKGKGHNNTEANTGTPIPTGQ